MNAKKENIIVSHVRTARRFPENKEYILVAGKIGG